MLVLNSEDFRDNKIIIDSSILGFFSGLQGRSPLEELYSGDLDSLLQITPNLRDQFLRYTDQIFRLMQQSDVFLLPEVVQENRVLLEKLNGHYSYFKGKLETKKTKTRFNSENDEHKIALGDLEIICNRVFKLNCNLRKNQTSVRWDVFPQRRLLHLARMLSRDMQRKSEERYSMLESSKRIGSVLETDQKLAAYLFLPEPDKESVLLTRDRGLILLARRMQDYIFRDYKETNMRPAALRARYYDLDERKVVSLRQPVNQFLERVYLSIK